MKILSTHSLNTDIGALVLRLIFGGLFTYHGYDAIAHYQTYLAMSTDIIGIGTKFSFDLVVFSQFFVAFSSPSVFSQDFLLSPFLFLWQ